MNRLGARCIAWVIASIFGAMSAATFYVIYDMWPFHLTVTWIPLLVIEWCVGAVIQAAILVRYKEEGIL